MKHFAQFAFTPPQIAGARSMDLYDRNGHRKYLTTSELGAFLDAAQCAVPEVGTYCGTLAYSGCRLSEALAITADRIDVHDGAIVIESLKKRRRGVYRAVPVPPAFLDALSTTHSLAEAHRRADYGRGIRLWNWSRPTAWRRVREVMDAAGITGMHATPKGLRHGFGIRAISAGVPLNMAQKWLGHSRISTTAIYANAIGPEEKQLAERMWASAPAISMLSPQVSHAFHWGQSEKPGGPPLNGPWKRSA